MLIPVCVPPIPKKAKEYVNAVIDKNWVSSLCLDEEVNFLKKFEEGFSSFIGVKYGTLTTSGTTALDLAVATLRIGKGDEVIVPTFTMVATANSVIHNGAKPVFVDADPETWCIDANRVEGVITERTKAIMPVHIYGYPAEMVKYFGNTFLATRVIFANQIYDLCQALGINYEIVKEAVGCDPRIGHSHFDIFADGYQGYGGECLPKDLKAFLQLATKKNVKLELLKILDKVNNSLNKRLKNI